MVWGTPGFTARLKGASGRSWALCFERRLAPRPGHAENPASSVWLVRDGNSGIFYAAKRQNVTHEQIEALVDEAAAWRAASLKAPVLAELVDVFVIREAPCSVTFLHEFCARGHVPKRAPSEPVLLTLIADLAEAAAVVSTATGAPHANISYSSVLVDQDGRLRLAGFGAQRSAKLAAGIVTSEDDVFDIAGVLYEIIIGRPMREPILPDDAAPYSDNVVYLLRDLLDAPNSRILPAEAAARARDLGAEPRAAVVDVSETAGLRAPGSVSTDEPAAPDIERAVEKLTTGVDAGGAYSAVLAALERNPTAASRSLFKSLFHCPIARDPLCTIRSLTMLHNIMLDGPDAVLEAVRGNDKFLDWVESTWTQEAIAAAASADDPDSEPPHPAAGCFAGGDLAYYTSFLRRKARFHMLAAGGFSGAWERTNKTAADGRDVLVTRRRKVVGGMADLAEMASELGIRFATSTDAETALKHASLRAIVDECGRAFNAALGLASETQSVRDTEKLIPSIGRLWDAAQALLSAVQGIRSAGADDWAEQFAADAPPDIVQEAEFRLRGAAAPEIADDMPKTGWEETEKMIGGVDEEEQNTEERKKEKKRKKKEKAEPETVATAVEEEEEEQAAEISAADGALVVHGAGDAAAAAVTTLFGDLLKMDGGDTSHLHDQPMDALNGRMPGELTDGEALASAFGAPLPSVTPALEYDDDDDDDGGYDNFRARQQEARVSASTGAWAARAGYGGGALVVHHSAETVPNKPHPAFCQCALCAQAEAQNAAAQAAERAKDGYSDEGYGGYGQREGRSRDDGFGNGSDSPGARNGNGNGSGYYKNYDDDGSYESVSYSVDVEHEYQPSERKGANRTADYDSNPRSGHAGSTLPLGQPTIVRESAPRTLRPEFVVNLKKLRTGDKLGEGAFGVVYKGEYKRETVAIKKMNKKMLASQNAMAEFSNEVHVMCSLSHPGVLKCIAASLTPPNVLMVTEFMKRGTLFDVLYKQHIKLTWSMIRKIALQLAEGLGHLEESHIVHRDIKAGNVLLDSSYNAKLGDFGLAGPPRAPSPDGVSGTYQYMAPEILTGAAHSSKSDVYAYGLVLCEMISGSPPFYGTDPLEAAQQVMNQNARPSIPPHCQRPYANIIQSCWGAAPASRPSFKEVVKMILTTTK